MSAREKNITFLIGNGFDVGMGMKSQYLDFYKVYTQAGGPYYPAGGENELIRALLAAEKEEAQEPRAQDGIQRKKVKTHWSDYEKWFGELTKQCDSEIWKGKRGDDYREKLLAQNEEFQQIFYKYLKDQEDELFSKVNANEKIVKIFRKISAGNAISASEGSNFQKRFGKFVDACEEAEKLGTEESGFSEKCQEWLTEFQEGFSRNQRAKKNEKSFEKRTGQVMLSGVRSFYSRRNIDNGETVIRDALNRDSDDDLLIVKRNYRFVCFNYSSVIDKCVIELNALRERRYKALIKKIGIAYEKRELPDFGAKSFKGLLGMFMPEYHEKVLVCIKDHGQKYFDDVLTLEEAKKGCDENLRRWFEAEKFQTVHHAHGSLHDPEHSALVMGVNDDAQIGENFGKRNKSYSNRLIKKNIMVEQGRSYQLDTTMELIASSDIIVVYGMSIGDTDKDYWRKLYWWLQQDPGHQLIFYMYEKDYEPLRANKQSQIIATHTRLFREMIWRVDSEVKWCKYSNQLFCFKPGNCPKSKWCRRKRCDGKNLAQWCARNGLGANNQSCEMTCCPYYTKCQEWNEIRKRIHFAVSKTIFGIEEG